MGCVNAMDYNEFLEELIVRIADRGDEAFTKGVELFPISKEISTDIPESWVISAPKEMQNRGWGKSISTFKAIGFAVDGGGFSAAAKIRSIKSAVDVSKPTSGTEITELSGRLYAGDGPPPASFGNDGDVFFQFGRPLEAAPASVALSTFDSAAWTGLSERVKASPELLENIVTKVREIELLIDRSNLSNEQKSSARSIYRALVALVDDPDPEWKIIVELLNSPKLTAVLNFTQVAAYVFAALGFGS